MISTLPRQLRPTTTRSSAMAATIRCAAYAAISLVVLAGCTTRWVVEQHQSRAMPTAGRETYYWQEGSLQAADAIDLAAAQSARRDIETSIITSLAVKGYRRVASVDDAAMIVSYVAQVGPSTFTDDQLPLTRWPGNVESTYASDETRRRMTTKNRVIIEIDDPATRRAIWRGVVDDEVRVSSTQHALELVVAMAGDIAKRIPGCRQ